MVMQYGLVCKRLGAKCVSQVGVGQAGWNDQPDSLPGSLPRFETGMLYNRQFSEGGTGASVRHISSSDNRGAGSCFGAQCRPYVTGTQVRFEVGD